MVLLTLTLRLAALSALVAGVLAKPKVVTHDGRVHGNFPRRPSVPVVPIPSDAPPVTSRNGTQLPPYNTTYYFDQLIDHNNPGLGTFKQRFWHTYEWYERGM